MTGSAERDRGRPTGRAKLGNALIPALRGRSVFAAGLMPQHDVSKKQGGTMAEEPPCEWGDGDRTGVALFAVLYGVVLSSLILWLLADTLQILVMAGVVSGAGFSPWATSPFILPPLLAGAFLVIFWPRLFANVSRLGISPTGLRIALPLRKVAVNWASVRWVGIDWVTVETRYGYQRYKLTANQVQRLNRFAQPR